MFKKIAEWSLIVLAAAIILFAVWIIGTPDSVNTLADKVGDWWAIILVVGAFGFLLYIGIEWHWMILNDND